MLETEKLDDLFKLLKDMTQPKSDPRLAPSPIARRLIEYPLIGSVLIFIIFLVLAAWQHFGPTPLPSGFYKVLPYFHLLLLVLALVPLVMITASTFFNMWRHRKQPFFAAWVTLENDLPRDANSITELLRRFNKATLAYGLLQYRHRWSSLESRAAVIGGNLRKFGLFPAWAALAISGAALFKEDSGLSLWALLPIVATMQGIAACVFLSHERRQQVIQLLEYAIQYADQGNATPTDPN